MTSSPNPAEPRSKDHENVQEELLEATVERLREVGLSELSLRDVADTAGTSTQMIYTLFGDKQGLLDTLYEREAEQLARSCRSVSDGPTPVHRLYELGKVYRRFALENRRIYSALFDPNLVDESIVRRTEVFELFRDVIIQCVREGYLDEDVDPDRVTDVFWSAAHGAVSLQIAGYDDGESAARRYNRTLEAAFRGFEGSVPDSLTF